MPTIYACGLTRAARADVPQPRWPPKGGPAGDAMVGGDEERTIFSRHRPPVRQPFPRIAIPDLLAPRQFGVGFSPVSLPRPGGIPGSSVKYRRERCASETASNPRESTIGVRRRGVSETGLFRVRFPCATATVLNFHSFVPALWSSPNCLQEWRPGKARKKPGRLHPERVAGNPAARPSHA